MKQWLSRVCCPLCKGSLEEKEGMLHCPHDQLFYEVREGIPILLPDSGMAQPSNHGDVSHD